MMSTDWVEKREIKMKTKWEVKFHLTMGRLSSYILKCIFWHPSDLPSLKFQNKLCYSKNTKIHQSMIFARHLICQENWGLLSLLLLGGTQAQITKKGKFYHKVATKSLHLKCIFWKSLHFCWRSTSFLGIGLKFPK